MVGVGLLYGCQRIRRWRATSTHQKTWRKAENHIQNDSAVSPELQHGTYPNSGIHLYDQPNLVTRSSADCLYQGLNEARSKEEHGYQGLRLTTRMKRAVESTGQP